MAANGYICCVALTGSALGRGRSWNNSVSHLLLSVCRIETGRLPLAFVEYNECLIIKWCAQPGDQVLQFWEAFIALVNHVIFPSDVSASRHSVPLARFGEEMIHIQNYGFNHSPKVALKHLSRFVSARQNNHSFGTQPGS
jgi:hypothetical protein